MMPASRRFADIMAFRSCGQQIVTSADFPPSLLATHCSHKPGSSDGRSSFENYWAVASTSLFIPNSHGYGSLRVLIAERMPYCYFPSHSASFICTTPCPSTIFLFDLSPALLNTHPPAEQPNRLTLKSRSGPCLSLTSFVRPFVTCINPIECGRSG